MLQKPQVCNLQFIKTEWFFLTKKASWKRSGKSILIINYKTVCYDSSGIFSDAYFVEYLSKAASENMYIQLIKIKYICPKL